MNIEWTDVYTASLGIQRSNLSLLYAPNKAYKGVETLVIQGEMEDLKKEVFKHHRTTKIQGLL
jgi:hypothetical protein